VCGEERTGYGFDGTVLPGHEDNRVAIDRLFAGGSRAVGIGEAEARNDRQPEKKSQLARSSRRAGRNRRRPVIFLLVRGAGSEDSARPAKSFGYDRRQRQSAIETLAVELTEPFVGLLPVPNEYDRLNGIVAPCTSPRRIGA
jgi:hypothetical protein